MAAQDLILAASAARTADGEGTALDTGRAGLSGSVALAVTASGGTGETLVVTLEHSDTGLADTWSEAESFEGVTGPTEVRKLTGTLKRYVRVIWTITGTAPSFTFEVKAKAYDHLITFEQFESHVGAISLARVFDDSGQGLANDDAVNSALAYASSMLRGKLGPVLDLSSFTPETQSEANRIGLDIAEARAAIRCPEVMRRDGQKMMDAARKDLREIRLGVAAVGSTDPEAQADETESYGVVVSGAARDNCW